MVKEKMYVSLRKFLPHFLGVFDPFREESEDKKAW